MNATIFTSVPYEVLKADLAKELAESITPIIRSLSLVEPPSEFITRKEAAKLLGVSLHTILDWTKAGKITGYRIASRVRYKRAELEKSLLQINTRR